MKKWKKERKFLLNSKIEEENSTEEKKKIISTEEIELHPELTRTVDIEKKPKRKRRYYVPKEIIDHFNKPYYTNIILGAAILLGLANICFGLLGVLAIFGLSDENSWIIFQNTAILGWEQLKVTGFVLIIIGIVMFWSVPLYLMDKSQRADSYLVIASGIGILFGFIYVLIVIGDILTAVVSMATMNEPFAIQTYFYLPIMLGVIALPIFRVLAIRHMVELPERDDEVDYADEAEIKWGYWRKHQWNGKPGFKHHHRRQRKKIRNEQREKAIRRKWERWDEEMDK